ncbi:MAG: hypothetical protein NC216_08980, partial [Bacteroides sp.]|nr:hypothetical protein [Bacteroides sp.]
HLLYRISYIASPISHLLYRISEAQLCHLSLTPHSRCSCGVSDDITALRLMMVGLCCISTSGDPTLALLMWGFG